MRRYSPRTARATPKSLRSSMSQEDPYLSKSAPKDYSVCRQCSAMYHNKHWSLKAKSDPIMKKMTGTALCPGCQKIQDRFPAGILSLRGAFMKSHKDEILHRIKNEEQRALGFNPLSRIIEIHEFNGMIEITTTNEKLAQRIGKSLHKAFKGHLTYKWSGNNKFTRVDWMRE